MGSRFLTLLLFVRPASEGHGEGQGSGGADVEGSRGKQRRVALRSGGKGGGDEAAIHGR